MGLSKEELAVLGVVDQDEALESAFARVLVLGPAKAGKTTCIVGTAPKPLVINCDGQTATKGAREIGGKFLVIDVDPQKPRQSLAAAVDTAAKLVESGDVKTIVLDTVTLLADNLLDQITLTLTGWDVWSELASVVMKAVKRLLLLDAHIFIVAHMKPDVDPAAGIMPAIGGQLKTRLPAMLDDWILLDVEAGRKPHERQWLLGPQKTWTHSGRNVRRTCAIEATVPALFAELGIAE